MDANRRFSIGENMNTLTEDEKMFLAALVDKSGAIRIGTSKLTSKRKTITHYGFFAFFSGEREKVENLKEMTGIGSVHHHKDKIYRGNYAWTIGSLQANDFFQAIYPYLKIKKAQAKILLDLYALPRFPGGLLPGGKGKVTPVEEIAKREELRLKLLALKAK
jgi:hypothetical protein